jgi:hypothetical protein
MRISCFASPRGSRDRDSRPARASGMVPSGRLACRLPRSRGAPRGEWCVCLLSVWYFAVRAGAQTRAPPPHRCRCDARLGSSDSPPGARPPAAIAVSRGRRTPRVPRGALSRCSKDPRSARPSGLRGRQTSSEAVPRPRTNSPNLSAVLRPLTRSFDRHWHAGTALASRRVTPAGRCPRGDVPPAVEPRGLEPRTSAVQGRRPPS